MTSIPAVSAAESFCAGLDTQAFGRASCHQWNYRNNAKYDEGHVIYKSMHVDKVKVFTSRGLAVAGLGWATGIAAALWSLLRIFATQYLHAERSIEQTSILWPWWQHKVEHLVWYFNRIAAAMIKEVHFLSSNANLWKHRWKTYQLSCIRPAFQCYTRCTCKITISKNWAYDPTRHRYTTFLFTTTPLRPRTSSSKQPLLEFQSSVACSLDSVGIVF